MLDFFGLLKFAFTEAIDQHYDSFTFLLHAVKRHFISQENILCARVSTCQTRKQGRRPQEIEIHGRQLVIILVANSA